MVESAQIINFPERTEKLRSWLSSDIPITWLNGTTTVTSPPLQQARDAIRAFLRNRPAVQEYIIYQSLIIQDPFTTQSKLMSARCELSCLGLNVRRHRFNARDQKDYNKDFQLASQGIL
jgi:hypothetical protein